MKKPKMPTWITNYWYSVGGIDEISGGTCEREQVTEDTDFSKLLFEDTGIILVPKVVGVYQERKPANETEKIKKEREECEEAQERFNKLFLSKMMDFDADIHPNLIHVGYDPGILPIDTLRASLNDKTKRIAFSPVNSVPNFFEKDQTTLYEIVNERASEIPEPIPEQLSLDERARTLERIHRFIPRIREVYEQLRPFGLTRNEFVIMQDYFIFEE